tara:strand:+ start:140 stop:400 length:261 start_codon:yes stop_codon:yes gene_type:complete
MIRVILSWLGWAFIVVGLFNLFEGFGNMFIGFTNDTIPKAQFGFYKTDFNYGFYKVALGAIMVGVYQLLIKSDKKEEDTNKESPWK